MKKISAILVTAFMSLNVFAIDNSKLASYECGLQVGKSLVKLEKSSVIQEAVNLSDSIVDFLAQTKIMATLKKQSEKDQVSDALNNSVQSIYYSIQEIQKISPSDAKVIDKACGLELSQ